MRTVRLSLTAMLVLVLLVGLAAAAVARTDGSTTVTGTVTWVASNASNVEFSEEGVIGEDYIGHGRGTNPTVGFEWSDPRLPSQAEMIGNFEYYGSEADGDVGAQVTINMWLLEDADGYWSGPWTGWNDEQDRWRGTVVLTGHGAYEGLYAVLTERPQEEPDGTVTKVLEGAILAGEMPPMPEPLEPTTE